MIEACQNLPVVRIVSVAPEDNGRSDSSDAKHAGFEVVDWAIKGRWLRIVVEHVFNVLKNHCLGTLKAFEVALFLNWPHPAWGLSVSLFNPYANGVGATWNND